VQSYASAGPPATVIDVDKNKFPENEEHLGEIITRIDAQLYGLF
jgi:hypothetical protein